MKVWKNIIGFPDYQVSSFGEVRSLKFGKVRILKPGNNAYGYTHVILCKNGKQRKFFVHRLVATAFLNNFYGKPTVDHRNGIRNDNRLINLRWYTLKEQCTNRKPRLFKKITKGGYYKQKFGYRYEWFENKIRKAKSFKKEADVIEFQKWHILHLNLT